MSDPGTRLRARTETFEITISGLLTKRAETFGEVLRLRDRLIEAEGDLTALDRVLGSLGYTGELEAVLPRQSYDAPFGRGRTMRAILDGMREAGEPVTARQIAERVAPKFTNEADGLPDLASLRVRVTKALGRLKRDGAVDNASDVTGVVRWSLRY